MVIVAPELLTMPLPPLELRVPPEMVIVPPELSVMVVVELRVSPLAMLIAAELVRPLLAVRVPPVTAIVPLVLLTAPDSVPKPVNVAPLPMVMPEVSVSVPAWIEIVPLVMLSAPPLIVRLPAEPLPTCSVWLALLMVIGAAEVAVPENSRIEPDTEAIENTGPLLTVPVRFSVPPLAVIAPLPETVPPMVPLPLIVAPELLTMPLVPLELRVPPEMVIVPPELSVMVVVELSVSPLAMVIAAELVRPLLAVRVPPVT